jgi:DNA polymerase-3 subunit epsilon
MSSLPTYPRWEDVPPHLKTKTGLGDMGLRLSRGQQPAAIKTHWDKKIPDYFLYDVSQAIPKKVSEKQKAAAERARQASLAKRTCQGCGFVEELGRRYRGKWYVKHGYCPGCRRARRIARDKLEAAQWAAGVFRVPAGKLFILDTETTDLDGEVVDMTVMNLAGEVVYSSHFEPTLEISLGAFWVHGLTAEMLRGCPSWKAEYERLREVLRPGLGFIIYNADFDTARIDFTCQLYGLEPIRFINVCLMKWYSQFVGEWSNRYRDYRWQKLPGGDHTALGDCRAALAVLKEMAAFAAEQDGGG